MEAAFAWLGQIFEALLQFVPRRVIVRATEGGVKWSLWRQPIEMKPGIRFYWPLITDVEIIVVARQPKNTRTQALMTKDGHEIVAGGVTIYKINDVVQAIGKVNWCPDATVGDITQAALVDVIAHWECDALLENISGKVEEQLTEKCRKDLRQYGVYVHRAALTDFSTSRQFNHSGINLTIPPVE